MSMPTETHSQGDPTPIDVYQDHVPNTLTPSNHVEGRQGNNVLEPSDIANPGETLSSNLHPPVEKSFPGEQASRMKTHPTQPTHSGRFSRPDMGDDEDFLAAFEFGKVPPKNTVSSQLGNRGNKSLTGRVSHLSNIDASHAASEGLSRTTTQRSNLQEKNVLPSRLGGEPNDRNEDSPRVPSHESTTPSNVDKNGTMQAPSLPVETLRSNSASAMKEVQSKRMINPLSVSNKDSRAEISHDFSGWPRDASPYKPLFVQSTHHSPCPDTSERGSRACRVKTRLEKHHKRRISTPISVSKLPKALAASREKALLLRKTSPPRQRTAQGQPLKSSEQPRRMTIRETLVHGNRNGTVNMPPPPRPDYRVDDNSRGDLAFRGGRTSQRAGSHAPNGKEESTMLERGQASPSTQYTETIRPESQASNISRPRDPPPDSFRRSTGRTRRNHNRKIEEGPACTRQEHHQELAKLTTQWNEFFMCNKTFMDHQATKVEELEAVIDKQDAMIQEHQLRADAYAADCDTLKMENRDLRYSHQQLENELTETTQRVALMEERLSTYRKRLSDAINEHQQLYTRYKDRCKETIGQLKEEKQNWKVLVEKEVAASNSSRVALQEKVSSVVRDARENAQELEKTIVALKVELDDRKKEVVRERDHANDLRAQLEKSHGLQQQTLQSIVVMGKELLEKSVAQEKTAEGSQLLVEQHTQKLHEILQAIEEVKTKSTESQTSARDIQDLMTRDLPDVMKELRHIISNCGVPAEVVTQLKDGIESISVKCDAIQEREINREAASDWQDRYHSTNLELANRNQQVEALTNELDETTEGWDKTLDDLENRTGQLKALQDEVINNQDSNRRLEELVEQVERLEQILNDKDQMIQKSEEECRAAKEELESQARVIQENEDQIRNDKEEHEKALNVAYQQQELEVQAISKERAELLQRKEELQERIDGLPNFKKVQQDCVKAQELSSKLAQDLLTTQAEREAFKAGHDEWARTRSEVIQIRQIVQRLAKEIPNARKNKYIGELCEIEEILSQKHIGHGEPSVLLQPIRQRLVQLREEHAGTPDFRISVEQERATRRSSETVRGIMKPVTRSAAKELSESAVADHVEERASMTQPAPRPRVARRGSQAPPNTYSSYNRIVAGNASSEKIKQEHEEEQSVGGHRAQPKPINNKRAQTDIEGIDEKPKKRQRSFTGARQRSKAGPSKSTSASLGGSGEVSKTQSGSVPTQPRPYHRSPSGLITYGSQQHRASHDDSQTSVASSATMRSTSSRSTPISSQIKEAIQTGFPQLELYEDYE